MHTMQITPAVRALAPAIEHAAPRAAHSLDAALAAGRLPGSRPAATLDAIEHAMATGTPIDSTRRVIGSGMNHDRSAVLLRTLDGGNVDVVEKPTTAQGAQEHFGWLLAREFGIDHRVAATARSADGTARIEHLATSDGWMSLNDGFVRTERDIERVLAKAIRAEAPHLDAADVDRTARIERQLLQVFDYVLANSDRNLGNGRVHQQPYALKMFDHGHAGAGQHERTNVLVPGLRSDLMGRGGRTTIDADTREYLRTRVDPDALAAAHRTAFTGANRPASGGEFARLNNFAALDSYRDGVVARFHHAVSSGELRYGTPGTSLVPPLQAVDEPVFRNALAQARFGAGGFGAQMF